MKLQFEPSGTGEAVPSHGPPCRPALAAQLKGLLSKREGPGRGGPAVAASCLESLQGLGAHQTLWQVPNARGPKGEASSDSTPPEPCYRPSLPARQAQPEDIGLFPQHRPSARSPDSSLKANPLS